MNKAGRKPLGRIPAKVMTLKLPGEDAEWLHFFSKRENIPKPELIREAVREYLVRRIEEWKKQCEEAKQAAPSFRGESNATHGGDCESAEAGGSNPAPEDMAEAGVQQVGSGAAEVGLSSALCRNRTGAGG